MQQPFKTFITLVHLKRLHKKQKISFNYSFLKTGFWHDTLHKTPPRFAKSSRDSLSVDAPYLMSLKKSIFPQRMTFQTDKNMRQPELL